MKSILKTVYALTLIFLLLFQNIHSEASYVPVLNNAVVRIQGNEFCTGTFVSPSVVLTAAHCIGQINYVTHPEINQTCISSSYQVDYAHDQAILFGCHNLNYLETSSPYLGGPFVSYSYDILSQSRQVQTTGYIVLSNDQIILDSSLVAGMSGSGLIQNNKLIGTISSRFADQPGGYGYTIYLKIPTNYRQILPIL